MISLFRFAYRRLGRRYPRTILWLQFQLAHLVVAFGVVLLTLYQDMSTDQFLRLLAASEVLMLVENCKALRQASRLLHPVDLWLRGERTDRSTIRAWTALVELPAAYMRRWIAWPILGNSVPFCLAATLILHLQWWAFFILFGTGLIVLLYGATLRFFGMELAMRPVLEHVGRELPAGYVVKPSGLSLRWRLLAGIPVLNVITGVVVAGLSSNGTQTLSDLGVDVLVAVIVSFTISLELTLLLSRSIVNPILELERATNRVGRGQLSTRLPVTSTDEVGQLTQAFNAAIAGLEEREKLQEAFGAFVDPHLAERVLREGTMIEGDEVEVSVLFLDIRGFTGFAERSSAREVVAALNELFECVVPIILRHSGHANKFVGDGLLAVFGAPDRLPDHADKALAAAIEIANSVPSTCGGTIEIGVGVNSGPVVAGTIGGGGRVDFTVIGDAVNTAARVEEATRATGDVVLITAATRALLSRRVDLIERHDIPLKGKTERVRLFAPAALVTSRPDVTIGDAAAQR